LAHNQFVFGIVVIVNGFRALGFKFQEEVVASVLDNLKHVYYPSYCSFPSVSSLC